MFLLDLLIVAKNEDEYGLQTIIVLVLLLVLVLDMLLNTEYEGDDENEDDSDNLKGHHLKTGTPRRDYSASPMV